MTRPERARRAGLVAPVVLLSCAPIAGIDDKPCRPGCVDGATRLVCAEDGSGHAEPCPTPPEACARATCQAGECGFSPKEGAPCGPSGSARCNEGYACLGPDLRMSAGPQHTCLVADDGKVWCWGVNDRYQLGDGTSKDSGHPVLVRHLPGPATAVSAGYAHTCAVVKSGDVYCWGDDTAGQCGTGSARDYVPEPTRVDPVGQQFIELAAGRGHTCGLTAGTYLSCWGDTTLGQCGIDPAAPGARAGMRIVGMTFLDGLAQVLHVETVKDHVCAVRTRDPTLVCWGSNTYLENAGGPIEVGKLGPAAAGLPYSAAPVPVDLGLVDLGGLVLDVGMGPDSTYALTGDRRTWAWGLNRRLQLGTQRTDDVVTVPSPVYAPTVDFSENGFEPLLGARDVLRSQGDDQCASVTDAIAYGGPYLCWGSNDHGELGLGSADLGHQQTQYAKPAAALPFVAENMVRGEGHLCVSAHRGKTYEIWCAGRGDVVANGTVRSGDAGVPDQDKPAPVLWDPAAFAPALDGTL